MIKIQPEALEASSFLSLKFESTNFGELHTIF